MARVVLVAADDPAGAAGLLAAAGRLAAPLGDALVRMLAVRMPAEASILVTEEVLTDRRRAWWDAREQARLDALHAAFARWRAGAGAALARCEWQVEAGAVEALVAAHGRRADYVVTQHPAPGGSETGREMVHAALFETSRPVLMVPPGFRGGLGAATFGATIAVAWKDDGRAVKAIISAMPLLLQAGRVRVLIGTREGAAAPGLPAVLSEHGIPASVVVLRLGRRGTFGAELLHAAAAAGADLLVMGAYAHSPWRQLLLGGVTRSVLAQATIPVLMRH